ncbi:MAG: DnaJ family molecular chaperone [Pseudomonadota bacterium]
MEPSEYMSIWRNLADTSADLFAGLFGAGRGLFEGGPGGPGGQSRAPAKPGARAGVAFTIALIALSAKIAKADGNVTDDEIRAFESIFEVPAGEAENVRRVYRIAMQDVAGYRHYARRIARLFRGQPSVLEDVLDALFFIALADQVVHPQEIDFLRDVAEDFGFSELQFERIRASNTGGDANDPFAILGVPPDISDEDLKRAYRRLVRENHPDALQGRGVPPEFRRIAEAKLAAINDAYRRVSEGRS